MMSLISYHVKKITKNNWPEKFEQMLGIIESNHKKLVRDISDIKYQDSYITFEGKLIEQKLFDIKDNNDIMNKIIKSGLKLYRK